MSTYGSRVKISGRNVHCRDAFVECTGTGVVAQDPRQQRSKRPFVQQWPMPEDQKRAHPLENIIVARPIRPLSIPRNTVAIAREIRYHPLEMISLGFCHEGAIAIIRWRFHRAVGPIPRDPANLGTPSLICVSFQRVLVDVPNDSRSDLHTMLFASCDASEGFHRRTSALGVLTMRLRRRQRDQGPLCYDVLQRPIFGEGRHYGSAIVHNKWLAIICYW